MLAALCSTSSRRVPGFPFEPERGTRRARRGLGAGARLDFFEGTANLTELNIIVTERSHEGGGRARYVVAPASSRLCSQPMGRRDAGAAKDQRTRWQECV